MTRWNAIGLAMVLVLSAAVPALPQEPIPFVVPSPDELMAAGVSGDRIRTQLTSRHEITLSSEVSARIAQLSLRPGDAFKAGTALVAFDCRLFEAQLAKAEATLAGSRQSLAVVTRLVSLGSSGELELAQAQARAAEAEAESLYLTTMVDKCVIAAPFDGRISRRLAQQHEYVTPGQPLLEIVDTGPLEVQLLVPSRWVPKLQIGRSFSVRVDEIGAEIEAMVTGIGATVDPVSQSITLTGELREPHPDLLPGMSGWARFDLSLFGDE